VLSEHQLLLFWLQLLALLLVARALGALARRFGQPSVVGELAAGLVLGPSLLGQVAPAAAGWLFPADPTQHALLAGVAWIGVFLLLVVTGVETDLGLIRRRWSATSQVAIASLVLPVLCGFGVGLAMPPLFLGPNASRNVFALFMATALGISALPVIAKVLAELDLMRRNVAQVLLAAAMANDVAGWILLGIVAGLAQSGAIELREVLATLLGLGLFLVGALTLGQRAVDALLRSARRHRAGVAGALSLGVLTALAAGAFTHWLGLEAVFGAFVAGVVLGNSRFQEPEVFSQLRTVTLSVFAPIFFATAGLRADLGLLRDPQVLLWGAIVLAAASGSKFVGAYLGARLAGLSSREGLVLGAGLNARGAVEIVVATVGLSLGVLNASSYTTVVLLAMATSMMAPPILRAVLKTWPGSPEEAERLERERLLGESVLVRPLRLLLPSHGGPNSILAARLVNLLWPEGQQITVLSAGRDVPAADLERLLAVLKDRSVEHTHVPAREPLDAILEHAMLGYGAVAVGATDLHIADRLVSPLVDDLLTRSPLPVIMVRRGAAHGDAALAPRRIVVPATGTRTGRAALEVACGIARRAGSELVLVHVVTAPDEETLRGFERWPGDPHAALDVHDDPRLRVGEQVLDEARRFAHEMGVEVRTEIRRGVSVPDVLLGLARELEADLVVLAANLRQLSGRPFLGHGVETLLERSDSTVIVVTAPPEPAR